MEWEVQKSKTQCEGCTSNFLDNQPFNCLLRLQGEASVRNDYCQRCWTQDIAPSLPKGAEVASWAARYRVVVPPPKEEALAKDHAEIVFRKMIESKDPTNKNIIFVLAVMLERKKILKQQKVLKKEPTEPGATTKRILVYSDPRTAESLLIEDPQIRLSQWDKVQKEVKDLLEDELQLLKLGVSP
jgi:hypothetical protein